MKKKLSLHNLKIQSFVTSIDAEKQERLLGGADPLTAVKSKINCSYDDGCITGGPACEITLVSPVC